MSKECKTARNTVVGTIVILMSIIMLCSSCGIRFGDYDRYNQVNARNSCNR